MSTSLGETVHSIANEAGWTSDTLVANLLSFMSLLPDDSAKDLIHLLDEQAAAEKARGGGKSIGDIFDRFVSHQGWNEASQLIILRRWVEEVCGRGRLTRLNEGDIKVRFVAFLQESADIENSP